MHSLRFMRVGFAGSRLRDTAEGIRILWDFLRIGLADLEIFAEGIRIPWDFLRIGLSGSRLRDTAQRGFAFLRIGLSGSRLRDTTQRGFAFLGFPEGRYILWRDSQLRDFLRIGLAGFKIFCGGFSQALEFLGKRLNNLGDIMRRGFAGLWIFCGLD